MKELAARISLKYKRHKGVYDFLLRMALLVLLGALLLLWMKSVPGLQLKIVNSTPVYHFSKIFVGLCEQILLLFGYESSIHVICLPNMEYVVNLCTPGMRCLYLAWPCLGVKIMILFIALIIVFPGKTRHKAWFIPLGLLTIQLFNVFRFSALTMILFHYPIETISDFDLLNLGIGYHDLFNWVLYIVIFALFVVWIRFFGLHHSDRVHS